MAATPFLAPHPRLFSGLSHEICRPLISLQVGCDLLLAGCEGPISGEQQGHLRTLRSQCDDLLRLTRTYLLDYAGLARSRPRMDWAVFRLGALLDEAGRQFADVARARRVDWSCRLEGDDAEVQTDLACFQRVLSRLVENAIDHTPPGAKVAVTARVEGCRWSLEVSDHGRGIPTEAISRVLEPLVRLPHAGCSTSGRYGLGLPVCRELVGQLGGDLTLDSTPGAGTSATVRFPVRQRS